MSIPRLRRRRISASVPTCDNPSTVNMLDLETCSASPHAAHAPMHPTPTHYQSRFAVLLFCHRERGTLGEPQWTY